MGVFTMPSLGADMDRGTVTEWLVAPGDEVHRGDRIAVVDTDKSTIEVEVFESGVVTELLVPEGVEVAVGADLAVIESSAPDEALPGASSAATVAARPAVRPVAPTVTSPVVRRLADAEGLDTSVLEGTGPGGRVTRSDVEGAAEHVGRPSVRGPLVSPRARRAAVAAGIDPTRLVGSGPAGSVVAADVRAALAAGATGGASTSPPAARAPSPSARTEVRRSRVGALMARSKRDIPHYYLSTDIDVSALVSWVDTYNAATSADDRIVPAAPIALAVARAAAHHPLVNGHLDGESFTPAPDVVLGVAVHLRGGGLLAPSIPGADRLDAASMMRALREVVAGARVGTLRSQAGTPATMTVTNLGERGVDAVWGVIVPPQVAMVGVGSVRWRPWAVDDTSVMAAPVVTVTLAADHRVSDGHDGAAFLRTVARLLAAPDELAPPDDPAAGAQ